jgi:hypothetical protein
MIPAVKSTMRSDSLDRQPGRRASASALKRRRLGVEREIASEVIGESVGDGTGYFIMEPDVAGKALKLRTVNREARQPNSLAPPAPIMVRLDRDGPSVSCYIWKSL